MHNHKAIYYKLYDILQNAKINNDYKFKPSSFDILSNTTILNYPYENFIQIDINNIEAYDDFIQIEEYNNGKCYTICLIIMSDVSFTCYFKLLNLPMQTIAEKICLTHGDDSVIFKIVYDNCKLFTNQIGLCDGSIKVFLENEENYSYLIIKSNNFDDFCSGLLFTFKNFKLIN